MNTNAGGKPEVIGPKLNFEGLPKFMSLLFCWLFSYGFCEIMSITFPNILWKKLLPASMCLKHNLTLAIFIGKSNMKSNAIKLIWFVRLGFITLDDNLHDNSNSSCFYNIKYPGLSAKICEDSIHQSRFF